MATTIALAAYWLCTLAPMPHLERAQQKVESGGNAWAVGEDTDRGLWQVTPIGWCAAGQEWGLYAKGTLKGKVWAALHPVVHLPKLNQLARRAIMKRLLRRSRGAAGPALRAYNCGNKGLLRECGDGYLIRLQKAGGRWKGGPDGMDGTRQRDLPYL